MKNRLLWLLPLASILILVILATAFYPAYNPNTKNVPIAILNKDEGTEIQNKSTNIGDTLSKSLTNSSNETIKWVKIKNQEELRKGFKEGEYVGAIIIDNNFSEDALSSSRHIIVEEKQKEEAKKVENANLSTSQIEKINEQQNNQKNTKSKQANIEIIVKQGSNGQVATIAQQTLNKVTDNMNNQISNQNVNVLKKNDINVPTSKFEELKNPIKVNSKTLNEYKEHQGNGNASSAMFTPIWFSSMIIAILSFTIFRDTKPFSTTKDSLNLWFKMITSILLAAFMGGFIYVGFTGEILNFNFNDPLLTSIYISISILGFSCLILGVMVWLGFTAMPLFVLLLFFSLQSVMMPKAMIPEFYHFYILPWNPFYHYVTALKSVLYETSNLQINGAVSMFIGFAIFGITSLYLALKTKKTIK
ncbi:ABC transporter permease [Staphylococcus saprophyticus]|uniref:ABC transporter permease n=1 Tax=Staphylococcus saprophyticus TaxID=29385 RepID=UPI000852B84E|nr:ABC transporter permease [Staphylococcus saprophyticus]OEK99531.1 hypothetical protein AST11_08965 [Staphylococcus saprophyticus]